MALSQSSDGPKNPMQGPLVISPKAMSNGQNEVGGDAGAGGLGTPGYIMLFGTRQSFSVGSGNIWHVTHRCHDKAFLLKFSCDRETAIPIKH